MVEVAPDRPQGGLEDPIPFALPDVGDEEAEAVAAVIRSGWVTSGPSMRAFEQEFGGFLGEAVETIAVNSCTAGLHLVLEALGIGAGDEVIVPDWTFTATAAVVRYLGAEPVIVDVDPTTLNIDPAAVLDATTNRTKAVIPVHFAGLPVGLSDLRDVLDGSAAVVEDAAHAFPAEGSEGLVGTSSHSAAAVFSFYATKTMTTGEGGMITTRDPQIAARARSMRLHGIDRDAFSRYTSSKPGWAYDVVAPGYKYNMPDTAAAMGRVQLRRARDMRDRRERIAEYYSQELGGLPIDLPLHAPPGSLHAWHLYVVRLRHKAPLGRDDFIVRMAEEGIGTSVHFIPLHQHTYWRRFSPDPTRRLPVAAREASRVVSLPISSGLSDAQVDRIVATVKALLR